MTSSALIFVALASGDAGFLVATLDVNRTIDSKRGCLPDDGLSLLPRPARANSA